MYILKVFYVVIASKGATQNNSSEKGWNENPSMRTLFKLLENNRREQNYLKKKEYKSFFGLL